jgi:hypothetical protein
VRGFVVDNDFPSELSVQLKAVPEVGVKVYTEPLLRATVPEVEDVPKTGKVRVEV